MAGEDGEEGKGVDRGEARWSSDQVFFFLILILFSSSMTQR